MVIERIVRDNTGPVTLTNTVNDARCVDWLVMVRSTSTSVPSAMQRSIVTLCAAGRANDVTERHKITIEVTISATTTAMIAPMGRRQRLVGRVVVVP